LNSGYPSASAGPGVNIKFGPVTLAAGVRPRHVVAFIVSALTAMSLLIFLNTLQPYLLTENLHLPANVQGRVSGNLVVMQETIALLLVSLIGSWSDRIGRRAVFAGGLAIEALALLVYPLCGTLSELVATRIVLALGAAGIAGTLAGIAADYPRNDSRGRFVSILLFSQTIGIIVLVANLAAKLPHWLRQAGYDAVTAGRWAFWLVGVVGLLGATIAARGMRPGRPLTAEGGGMHEVAARPTLRGILADLRGVAAQARQNPRLALVFPVAVIARGDASIAITFLSLWVVTAARQHGIASAEAVARMGTVLSVFTVASVAMTLCAGFLIDRLDRARAVTLAALATGLAQVSSGLVDDVMGSGMLVFTAVLGVAESSLIISGQVLLGEQAAVRHRGATVGAFGVCGSLGVLVITFAAGQIFDRWTYAGPFMAVGVVNLLVFSWAWFSRARMRLIEAPEDRASAPGGSRAECFDVRADP
jgi:MFS family permease